MARSGNNNGGNNGNGGNGNRRSWSAYKPSDQHRNDDLDEGLGGRMFSGVVTGAQNFAQKQRDAKNN